MAHEELLKQDEKEQGKPKVVVIDGKWTPRTEISYRDAILWNAVSSYYRGQFTEFYRKVKKDIYFKELDFSAQSAQSLPRHYLDFKCF